MTRCKLCNLDKELREQIDEDIMRGRGPKYLQDHYPEVDIKIHNVYTHKPHIVKERAKELYERALKERAEKAKAERQMRAPVDENVRHVEVSATSDFDKRGIRRVMSGSVPVPDHVDDLLEVVHPNGIRNMAERLETTGVWWQDSINILDVFIARGSTADMLDKLMPRDVLAAIDKKAEMMERYAGAEAKKDDKEENVKISSILHVMNEKEQGRIDDGAAKKLLEVLLDDDEKKHNISLLIDEGEEVDNDSGY